MVLIRIPQTHDMVLEFESEPARKKFLTRLESFVGTLGKSLEVIPVYKRMMLATAETKERRQKKLEHFFREAYALTFGLR